MQFLNSWTHDPLQDHFWENDAAVSQQAPQDGS